MAALVPNVLKLKYLWGQNIVKMKNVFEALKSFEEDCFVKKKKIPFYQMQILRGCDIQTKML